VAPGRKRKTIHNDLYAVALNVPAGDGVFTYRIPAELGAVEPGRRVVVPLGRRTETGVVLGPGEPAGDVRAALRLLDEAPLLTAEVIALVRWAAAHYLAPLGPAVKAALPPGLDVRDALVSALTDAGRAMLGQLELPGSSAATPAESGGSIRALSPRTDDAVRRTLRKAASGAKVSRPALESLARRGLVTLQRAEAPARVSAPLVEMAEAVPGASVDTVKRAPRQAELLAWLLARTTTDGEGAARSATGGGGDGREGAARSATGGVGDGREGAAPSAAVPVEELLAAFPGARPQLRALVRRKLALVSEVAAGAAQFPEAPWGSQQHDATQAQASALREVTAALDARTFAPFLLHGVTGSGKTWVYLEAIAHARAQGFGALALVPEIALTPQLAGRFRARFGDDVAVLHSGLSERERVQEWTRVRDGRAGIVVGARSAVWAPVVRLGIVVVDEEHEPSYKQEDRLRYQARDVALVRAQKAGAVAVLGSATPSLETLRRAQEGRLRTLRLPERVDARPLPALTLIKRRVSAELLTAPLAAALRETLERGEQAILFLNRRGYTRTLLCASCGAAVGCPNCSVALVLHRFGRERLQCHLCGHDEAPRAACSACGGTKLTAVGGGTEKVEEELAAIVPSARIARLDRDAAGGPGQAAAILARFARRELDLLVGTQMVAKGHDFPGVTLVGVLDADGPLHLPDFRAAERCVQLLTQVSGRAGRGLAPGRVLVQAFRPEVVTSDYDAFAQAELGRRELLQFPPFVRLAALRLQGNAEPRVRGAAERLASAARRLIARGEEAEVLGPAPAPLARLRGKHRWQLLLRATDHGPLHRLGRALLAAHDVSGVELSVDIDPGALL
jgi:primosomal protein N' (replication factor Y) (superfamily II helicase)